MKRFLLVLTALLFIFTLSSCSEKKGEVIRIGLEGDYAPLNWSVTKQTKTSVKFANGANYAEGYDVEIAKRIANNLNYSLEIYQMVWDSLIPSLNSNKIDLVIAGMSPSEERKQHVTFSNPYWETKHVILLLDSNPFYKPNEDLDLTSFKGARFIGQQGTFFDSLIDQLEGVKHETPLDNVPKILENLRANKADCTIVEEPVAMSLIKANPSFKYLTLKSGFQLSDDEKYLSIALRKGDERVTKINDALSKISDQERHDLMQAAVDRYDAGPVSAGFFSKFFHYLGEYGQLFLIGVGYTLLLALCGTLFGLLIAFLFSFIRVLNIKETKSKFMRGLKRFLAWFVDFYVLIFRGTPMMVQAMIFYYGLGFAGVNIHPILAGIITISLNTTAYLAEVLRGGMQAIDKGQIEAARSLGFSNLGAFFNVTAPQSLKNVFPSIVNEFIVNIKDSSVLNVIQVTELFFFGSQIGNNTYDLFTVMLIVALIYLFLTSITSLILGFVEKKLGLKKSAIVSSN